MDCIDSPDGCNHDLVHGVLVTDLLKRDGTEVDRYVRLRRQLQTIIDDLRLKVESR